LLQHKKNKDRAKLKKEQKTEEDVIPSRHNLFQSKDRGESKKKGEEVIPSRHHL
jgi:hypothetical protein